MKQKFLITILFILSGILQTFAQQKTVTGRVTDKDGNGLPGVSVIAQGSRTGTQTGSDGSYSLSVAPNVTTLVFSSVGFGQQEVSIAGRSSVDIAMEATTQDLNAIVVVGYTTQKKGAITGAISVVNMADLEQRRVPDVAQLLQGQVAGVQVTQSTGAPGDGINITIRGVGTFAGSSPLFIVDGLPSTDISFLNPTDIQSMTVLKDAAAAAIYGSRASGGVIVITTKSGRKGKSNLDINYYNGIQKVANLPKMLNATQYMNKMEESWNNSGYPGTNPYTADKSRTDLANTDWLHELFVLGKSQSLQLSASGGSDKVQYLISGGYYGQNGIVIYNNDQYQRLNFRTNINANITDRFTVGTNLQISNSVQDKMSSSGDAPGVIRHAFIRPPVIAVYKDKN